MSLKSELYVKKTGEDLGWFFDQWVNSNKFLSYEIYSKKSEKKVIDVYAG